MRWTPNKERALQALLVNGSVRVAAAAANLTERTLYGYLSESEFSQRLIRERDEISRGVAARVVSNVNAAIDVVANIILTVK